LTLAGINKDRAAAGSQATIDAIAAMPLSAFTSDPVLSHGSGRTSSTGSWSAWFGGTAGDGFDQFANFASGLGDNASMGVSRVLREQVANRITGMNSVDYNSAAYKWGDRTGTAISLINPLKSGVTGAFKFATAVDDMGRCANFVSKFVRGGCFVPGTLVTLSDLPPGEQLQSALWASDSFLDDIACHGGLALMEAETQTAITFKIPIEDVPLGARVPTKNPRPWEYDDSLPEPDEATWAKISLTIERTDGGVVDAELIRPRAWVDSYDLQPGTTLSMHIEELKIDGDAFITSIDPCPVIAGGDGSVVTARFMTRQVDELATVTILGPDGQTETLTGTTIHPIWSVDRQDWTELAELQEGETLQAANGLATVLSVVVLHQCTPVYNFEVHGEHVYQVGELGLLVHNTLACVGIGKAGELAAGVTAAKTGIRSVLNPGRWRFPDDLSIPGILKEVKNVKSQGLTSQIRDYIEIAKTTGRTMELWVRTGTTLSKNLLAAEASGKLIINRVL
jgi:hypothetical protein